MESSHCYISHLVCVRLTTDPFLYPPLLVTWTPVVKYSFADNMGQGKKIPPCRKRATCELYDSYFRSMTIKHAIPKTAEMTHSDGQLWEEIAGAWMCVHISAWEYDGNIRPTNWTEDSEEIPLFTQACPVVAPWAFSRPSSTYIEESRPHRRTILIPLLIAPTSHKRPSRK